MTLNIKKKCPNNDCVGIVKKYQSNTQNIENIIEFSNES